MKLLFIFFNLCLSFFGFTQVPAYYNDVDLTLTGQALKIELAQKITTTHTTNLSYSPGVWQALQQTDLDPNNSNNVLLIYGYDDTDGDYITDRSRDKFANGGTQGSDWNREHTYPKSLGTPNLGTSGPGADAHHLRAADVRMNGDRGNLPYEDAPSGGTARRISNSWYPGDEWKGDVARMMMYMFLRYNSRCDINRVGVGAHTYHPEIPDVFLKWNAEDPVNEYELNRNNILEGIQGNRNPFIDNPAFATTIWGGPQAEERFNSTVLPVKLIEFTACKHENSIDLSWKTASEINHNYFAIERSQDGINWAEIGRVISNGSANQETTYFFTDDMPLNGHNYYCLKQVDFNGTTDYSSIESVVFQKEFLITKATRQLLEIDFPENGATSMKLYNAHGKLVWQRDEMVATGRSQFTINGLNGGVYIFIVTLNGSQFQKKFIIK